MKTRYRNIWHDPDKRESKEFFEHDCPIYMEHKGYKVYKLFDKHFDIVFDDVCISQRTGTSKELIDDIESGTNMYTRPGRDWKLGRPWGEIKANGGYSQ